MATEGPGSSDPTLAEGLGTVPPHDPIGAIFGSVSRAIPGTRSRELKDGRIIEPCGCGTGCFYCDGTGWILKRNADGTLIDGKAKKDLDLVYLQTLSENIDGWVQYIGDVQPSAARVYDLVEHILVEARSIVRECESFLKSRH
jgi:hypothetical protein